MENRRDIGKAINDKLNALHKTPKEQVWTGIYEELQKKKRRRFIFFFFWTSAIGLLFIGTMATFYIYRQSDDFEVNSSKNSNKPVMTNTNERNAANNDNDIYNAGNSSTENPNNENVTVKNSKSGISNRNVVDTEKKLTSNDNASNKNTNKKENSISKESFANSKNTKVSNKIIEEKNSSRLYSKSGKNRSNYFSKVKAKKPKEKAKKEKPELSLSEIKNNKKNLSIADLTLLKGNSDKSISEIKSKNADTLAAKKTKDKDKTININMYPKEKKDSIPVLQKFALDAFLSPTHYGYFNKESTLDRRLDSLPKKTVIKFSYGIGLTYDLSEKLSFRIGYNKVNICYIARNAPIDVSNYSGIDYNTNTSNETILIASQAIQIPIGSINKMDITQKISYTEIPFEFKYKFLDKKLGLKSSVGFSYLLLNENEVSIKTANGYKQNIGKTKGLSQTSLSANVGIEIDYPLFKNMRIFAEPTFNYQIKAFSESAFKPYFLGIHTGFRYSFNN